MRLFSPKGLMLALLAMVMVALLVADAQAGIFRRRAKCQSCQPAQVRGYYALPPVVQGCAGGSCLPQSFPAFVPYSIPAAMPAFGGCPDGKCPLKK